MWGECVYTLRCNHFSTFCHSFFCGLLANKKRTTKPKKSMKSTHSPFYKHKLADDRKGKKNKREKELKIILVFWTHHTSADRSARVVQENPSCLKLFQQLGLLQMRVALVCLTVRLPACQSSTKKCSVCTWCLLFAWPLTRCGCLKPQCVTYCWNG